MDFAAGPDKYDVSLELPSEEAGDVLTTQHLAYQVEKLTHVPQKKQRLIFKGKRSFQVCL